MPSLIEPAYLWIPDRVGSYGDEAADLAKLVGRPLDDEQRLSVDAILSYGPRGKAVAIEACRIEARQNGKTGGELLPVALYDLFLGPPDKIMWTAHVFKTAQDAFQDFVALIDGCHDLARRVKKISFANGEEAIRLKNGAALEFLARAGGGGRGLGGKRIIMDEALFLRADLMGTLMPTMAARSMLGDPQILYGSSAGKVFSDHLRKLRDRGRRGGDPSLIYIEHCAPGSFDDPGCALGPECPHDVGIEGCSLDNEDYVRQANPAVGRRISMDYVRGERRALPPVEYARERLSWWEDPVVDGAELLTAWALCADADSKPKPDARPVFAIDVSPGSKSAAIVACMFRPDGLPHLELVAYAPGADWVAKKAAELKKHKPLDWVLDPAGPAGSLLPALQEHQIEPRKMSSRDLGQACEQMARAIDGKKLRHIGTAELSRAINGSARRAIGDGLWAWNRVRSDADISPLVAATEAFWGLSVVPPEKPKPPAPVNLPASAGPRSETFNLATAGF